jgi:hypothetical protein
MQLYTQVKRFVPLIAVVALVMFASCGTKKYGCPGHMFTPPTLAK